MHCATCTVQHCTHNPKIHFPPALLPALCPAARHVRSALSKARHGSTAGQRQDQATAGSTGSWQCPAPLSAQRARSCCFATAWQGREPAVATVVHGAGTSDALLHCAPGPELLPWPQGHGAIGPWGYEQLWSTVRPAAFQPAAFEPAACVQQTRARARAIGIALTVPGCAGTGCAQRAALCLGALGRQSAAGLLLQLLRHDGLRLPDYRAHVPGDKSGEFEDQERNQVPYP